MIAKRKPYNTCPKEFKLIVEEASRCHSPVFAFISQSDMTRNI